MYTHRINKVSLDFSFTKEERDTALQTTRQLFYDKAMPQLDILFNNINEKVHIDKLEIDLGKTTTENFEQDFIKALKSTLQQIQSTASLPEKLSSVGNGLISSDVLFFLERGYWPWNFQQANERELLLLLQSFFKNESFVKLLLQQLASQQPELAERLIHIAFDHISTRKPLIQELTKHHPALANILPFLPTSWEKQASIPGNFYFLFLCELIVEPILNDVNKIILFIKQLIEKYGVQLKEDKDGIIESNQLTQAKSTEESLQSIVAIIENRFSKKINFYHAKDATIDKDISTILLNAASTSAEKINILNAGLILFHPYLQPVFRDLKWLNKQNQFLDGRTQQRAVLFLQYLVNGNSRHAEHLLVLNKILCNWPVHLALPTSCNFSAREKSAANDLIESFREHWTVMKNTSHRGLIESFVARPGLVQKKPDGFLLQMERKTIDILMDSLPFGINTIKLPWNEYFIYTEW